MAIADILWKCGVAVKFKNYAVFARVTPEQKRNLVKALRRRGHHRDDGGVHRQCICDGGCVAVAIADSEKEISVIIDAPNAVLKNALVHQVQKLENEKIGIEELIEKANSLIAKL